MEIVSDGGPEYIGNEYVTFCKEWDIEHTYSSPEYPQSNGLAERTCLLYTSDAADE